MFDRAQVEQARDEANKKIDEILATVKQRGFVLSQRQRIGSVELRLDTDDWTWRAFVYYGRTSVGGQSFESPVDAIENVVLEMRERAQDGML